MSIFVHIWNQITKRDRDKFKAITTMLVALLTMPYIVVVVVRSLSNYISFASGVYISNEVQGLLSVIVLVLLMSASIVATSEYLRKQSTKKRALLFHQWHQENPGVFRAGENYKQQKRIGNSPSLACDGR